VTIVTAVYFFSKNGSDYVGEKEPVKNLVLNEQERRLVQMIREMKYGEIHIFVMDSKPVRAEKIKKSIKL
jgi:hypothetical protein